MSEKYSEGSGRAAGAEAAALDTEWRALLARLLPTADVDLLVRALRSEASRSGPAASGRDPDLPAAERELARVRATLARGAATQGLQHTINNPLGALMAEAQLLELEPLADEHRVAVRRIVELARRLAGVVRRIDTDQVAAGGRTAPGDVRGAR
jgi:signal transduction histidine kinase